MATTLTSKQKEVIRKIIYAVETGGQTYGKQNYASLIGAGTNTSNEVAITIGAGQWYATEAKTLLNLIRATYPDKFKALDNQGIASDLDFKNWSTYSISVSSAKAKCIVNIINSTEGIKCQDTLMEKQITEYASEVQKTYGDMPADAIAECINIKHQGGAGALKRILAKTSKPYTSKTIYAALCTDPDDKSNNNQVGDYVTRQKKVYEMITTYLIPTMSATTTSTTTKNNGGNTMSENEIRAKVANWLVKYLGIREGSSEHKAILAVFNDSKLCTRYKMTTNDAWCATAVSAAFIACGLASIFPCVECSCYYMVEYAKKAGIWVENDAYTPKVGDVILYDWDDSGYGDNQGTPDHVGIVISISGNTFKVIEGNMSNTVGYRTLTVNAKYIRGFVTPKFHTVAQTSNSTSGSTTPESNEPKPSVTPTTLKYAVGDIVEFTGTTHYVSAGSTSPKACKAGKATVTAVSKGSKHPYHLIALSGSGSNVYGWVDESDVKGKVSTAPSGNTSSSTPTTSTTVDYATSYSKSIAGSYKTTDELNLRAGAGTGKKILCAMPKGSKVTNYGYYSTSNGVKWYYVAYTDKNGKSYVGFCSSNFLKK